MKEWLTGFRKFTMAIIFLAVAVVLLVTGLVPPNDWLKHVGAVMTAFMATNVGEHLIQIGKEWIQRRDIDKVMDETIKRKK